ncbi:hypothetical protein IGI04_014392 [Brassica rapa subsp. trilocularis]|uniref:RNase H type-1 domain-containing protein n=1 Tax=Brassica rapa subsp. trilocularis TaxID=1813537 RepID=A0ABQ7MMS5_BRACM|nr:hypothetical protein IGI04_014392 [Brassica rapa subsp. trilocularis]
MLTRMEKYEAAPVELLASKISVWWDITSCPVPEGYDPRLVLLQAYSSTGIVLKHDPFIESSYSEGGVASFIAVELFGWKLWNLPPASVVFISDPQNISRLTLRMHTINMRGYNILHILKDTPELPIRFWGWKSFLKDARMGKKIQEDELDDFNVEPVGIVCRGTLKIKAPNNAILCKDSASRSYVGSALVSEALAVRNALRAAAALGLTTLNLFSDSLVLISTLLSGSDLNEIVGLLVDLRNLASLFNHLSFSHVSPTCNVMADSLAKSALARLMADNALFRA